MKSLALLLIAGCCHSAIADYSKAKVYKQKNSKCVVHSTASAYPTYKVKKGDTVLYSPVSDGVLSVLFSPTGKYVALSGGGMESLLDIEKNKFEWGVVVVNCLSGRVKGYLKGKATLLDKWQPDDGGIILKDYLTFGRYENPLPK